MAGDLEDGGDHGVRQGVGQLAALPLQHNVLFGLCPELRPSPRRGGRTRLRTWSRLDVRDVDEISDGDRAAAAFLCDVLRVPDSFEQHFQEESERVHRARERNHLPTPRGVPSVQRTEGRDLSVDDIHGPESGEAFQIARTHQKLRSPLFDDKPLHDPSFERRLVRQLPDHADAAGCLVNDLASVAPSSRAEAGDRYDVDGLGHFGRVDGPVDAGVASLTLQGLPQTRHLRRLSVDEDHVLRPKGVQEARRLIEVGVRRERDGIHRHAHRKLDALLVGHLRRTLQNLTRQRPLPVSRIRGFCPTPRQEAAEELTWTAKSAMMTPCFGSAHHMSKSSREMPLCSMDGVASTTQGRPSRNPLRLFR